MWKRIVGYGALLAAGTLALQWLDYLRLARMHSGDIYLFLVAAAFLVLGIVLGVRVFAAPAPVAFDGNPKTQAELGLSEREFDYRGQVHFLTAASESGPDLPAAHRL